MRDRSIMGIILVLLGAGFLLDQFNVISFGNIISIYWPVILIVLGLVGIIDRRSSKTGSAILLIFGILFQARNLGLMNVNIFRTFWPIILIIVGVKIIFGKDKVFVHKEFSSSSKSSATNSNASINEDDYINESALMSGINTRVGSQDFKGGTVSSTMGEVKLDLRDAKLHNNEASLNISVVMGEVKVYVPSNWKIKYSGKPIMGEFYNRTRHIEETDAPVLNINFSVFMGSLIIE